MREPTYIDEEHIATLCKALLRFPEGYLSEAEFLRTLREVDSIGPFFGEKTSSLRQLAKPRRGMDLDSRNHFIRCDVQGIAGLASIHNHLAREKAEEDRILRVEISEPYGFSFPLTFLATIYVKDKYHGSVSCVVEEIDMARFQITNHSLSRPKTLQRKLEENWHHLRWGFQRHVLDQFKAGKDLSQIGQLAWKSVERAR